MAEIAADLVAGIRGARSDTSPTRTAAEQARGLDGVAGHADDAVLSDGLLDAGGIAIDHRRRTAIGAMSYPESAALGPEIEIPVASARYLVYKVLPFAPVLHPCTQNPCWIAQTAASVGA